MNMETITCDSVLDGVTNVKTIVVENIKNICSKFNSEDELILFLSKLSKANTLFISKEDQIKLRTSKAELVLIFIKTYRELNFLERSLNVRTGIQSAKLAGKKLGRPIKRDVQKIKVLRKEGLSIREIASALGLSVGSIHKSLNG